MMSSTNKYYSKLFNSLVVILVCVFINYTQCKKISIRKLDHESIPESQEDNSLYEEIQNEQLGQTQNLIKNSTIQINQLNQKSNSCFNKKQQQDEDYQQQDNNDQFYIQNYETTISKEIIMSNIDRSQLNYRGLTCSTKMPVLNFMKFSFECSNIDKGLSHQISTVQTKAAISLDFICNNDQKILESCYKIIIDINDDNVLYDQYSDKINLILDDTDEQKYINGKIQINRNIQHKKYLKQITMKINVPSSNNSDLIQRGINCLLKSEQNNQNYYNIEGGQIILFFIIVPLLCILTIILTIQYVCQSGTKIRDELNDQNRID